MLIFVGDVYTIKNDKTGKEWKCVHSKNGVVVGKHGGATLTIPEHSCILKVEKVKDFSTELREKYLTNFKISPPPVNNKSIMVGDIFYDKNNPKDLREWQCTYTSISTVIGHCGGCSLITNQENCVLKVSVDTIYEKIYCPDTEPKKEESKKIDIKKEETKVYSPPKVTTYLEIDGFQNE